MTERCLERELAERVRSALERRDPLELVAEVNSFLEERGLGRVIVVGGYAVELYSGGAYRTGDVDVIVEEGGALVRRALSMIEKWRGRVWIHEALSYAIDIVASFYDEPKQPVVLEVGGKRVYVEPSGGVHRERAGGMRLLGLRPRLRKSRDGNGRSVGRSRLGVPREEVRGGGGRREAGGG